MTERERLIELLLESEPIKERLLDDDWFDGEIADIADYLLANGVIVLPCKVGDTVYVKGGKKRTIEKIEIQRVYNPERLFYIFTAYSNRTLSKGYVRLFDYEIGKTVFLTREEAERALKEGTDTDDEERSVLLEDLNLSVKTYNTLKRAGINNTAQLHDMGTDKLRTIKGLGTKAVNEVIDRCADVGIKI